MLNRLLSLFKSNHTTNTNTYNSSFCYFCRLGNHTVYECQSSELSYFTNSCMEYLSNVPSNHTKESHLKWEVHHRGFLNRRLVKGYAMKYCGANMNDSLDTCVSLIVNKFCSDTTTIQSRPREITVPSAPPEIVVNVTPSAPPESMATLSVEIKLITDNNNQEIGCECLICLEEIDLITLNCNHTLCISCVNKLTKKTCPYCIQNIKCVTVYSYEHYEKMIKNHN